MWHNLTNHPAHQKGTEQPSAPDTNTNTEETKAEEKKAEEKKAEEKKPEDEPKKEAGSSTG